MRRPMKKMLDQPRRMNPSHRVIFLLALALLVVIGFIARLFYLQIYAGDNYRQAALAQRRREVKNLPKRGTIYDRDKNPLAISVTVNTCYFFPGEVGAGDEENTAQTLSMILALDKDKILEMTKGKKNIIRLKSKLSEQEIKALKNSGIRCYSIEQESERYYPNKELNGQVLGFVNDEGKGIYGLEASYDKLLRGSAGEEIFSRDLHGYVIPTEAGKEYDSRDGQNLYCTIDSTASKIVYEELQRGMEQYRPKILTAIMMNPMTSEVLAMESLPNYDPNDPRKPLNQSDKEAWDSMKEEDRLNILYKRWSNPAISDTYEPGSVFKTLTTAISLESRSCDKKTRLYCNGSIEISPGTEIHCVSEKPHGPESLQQALTNSCNPAFVQIVWLVGPQKFYSYLESLHMGGRTKIDAPSEPCSTFPPTLNKMGRAQFATMAYGHGIAVTPLQMITACNATINGGYYIEPHFFLESTSNDDKLLSTYKGVKKETIFSKETSDIMRDMLVETVQGSRSKMMDLSVEAGGKSGTSIVAENGVYNEKKTIASYYTFFPAHDPKISLLVVAQEPETGVYGFTVAGDICQRISKRYLEEKGGNLTQTKELARIPDLRNKTVDQAQLLLARDGLSLSKYGNMNKFTIIDSQDPKPGDFIRQGQDIQVHPRDPLVWKVPNLIGKDLDQAKKTMEGTGIEVIYEGKGKVVSQNPKAGEEAGLNTTLVITLREEKKEEKPASLPGKEKTSPQKSSLFTDSFPASSEASQASSKEQ